ncbi:MAG: hypothetical protein A4E66_01636 [Syntrophus sp. PtaB.Bin001]|nr:MAG: hypothetical protein A4E66_01636 [Syntrophus sp. PtaB.Bin001]
MKINVLTVLEAGLDLRFDLQGDWFRNFLAADDVGVLNLLQTAVSCHVSRTGEALFIAGEIGTVVETVCCRCLETVRFPVCFEFRYTLVPVKENIKDNLELRTEDLEFGFYQGEVVDLTPLIYEQIMLQIPMKVLCSDSCKGLCPQCGANMNTGDCNCRKDQGDGRFEVLRNLKISKK